MLFIIGTTSLIKPIAYNASYNFDIIMLIVATILLSLFPIIPPKNRMNRANGLIYLIFYAIYVVKIFI